MKMKNKYDRRNMKSLETVEHIGTQRNAKEEITDVWWDTKTGEIYQGESPYFIDFLLTVKPELEEKRDIEIYLEEAYEDTVELD